MRDTRANRVTDVRKRRRRGEPNQPMSLNPSLLAKRPKPAPLKNPDRQSATRKRNTRSQEREGKEEVVDVRRRRYLQPELPQAAALTTTAQLLRRRRRKGRAEDIAAISGATVTKTTQPSTASTSTSNLRGFDSTRPPPPPAPPSSLQAQR